jgi:uncharacterized protein
MSISRRAFMRRAGAVGAGFAGLHTVMGRGWARALAQLDPGGYGPLVNDPAALLDLPEGFTYSVFSRQGEEMDDGLLVPGRHDGMAAFPGEGGTTILVRNHENEAPWRHYSPFGRNDERLGKIDRRFIFDAGYGRIPLNGGTTTLVYDTRSGTLVRHFLSLAGTHRNCAGGPTPWGTWLTCEEDVTTATDRSRLFEQDHGWVFEVKATMHPALSRPEPIRPMGRFMHEAVAVDPATGIVYMTEDRGDGLIYRYVPKEAGRLAAGGRLQAMAARSFRGLDTRNWPDQTGKIPKRVGLGAGFETDWIDLDEVLAPKDDLRERGAARGAAVFARGEGMWYGGEPGAIYWVCTQGGREQLGQIWRYTPSPNEGKDERSSPGRFQLFIEPNEASVLRNADNITFSPRGDIIVCEDCGDENRLLGVTPQGEVYTLARNARDKSEFAGATFSPDGSTLFVNIQDPGSTLAIRGPWKG